MDKQKLITIAKDQLKGGIGEDQVRELLIYRGVEQKDVDAIMQEALRGNVQPAAENAGDVLRKTDMAIAELAPDAPVQPEYLKKERNIIVMSIVGFVLVVVAGATVYYLYF